MYQTSWDISCNKRHSTERLKQEDPAFRAVIFSQFTSFLDLIQTVLQREKYEFYRFDGTMDVKKKSSAISAFKAPSNKSKVLIISLKAGGVGLNVNPVILVPTVQLLISHSSLPVDKCKPCIYGMLDVSALL
jgi:DNA repair protein RAD5